MTLHPKYTAFSNAELAGLLPGFVSSSVELEDVRLHYVHGGRIDGQPLVLLPGWPQTWWQFSPIMSRLAEHYRVITVDLRGMGGSSAPSNGYDKRTMAADIHALIQHLKLGPVHLVGNDIGSMVAYSFAANHQDATRSLVMLDAPHPFEVFQQIPLIPPARSYDLLRQPRLVHPWWFAFHQLAGLVEPLCAGRYNIIQDWIFDYLAVDPSTITPDARAIYAAAYDSDDALRAVNGWFSAFPDDIAHFSTYAPLQIPVLGLGGISADLLTMFLATAAPSAKMVTLTAAGHWLPEEKPAETVREILQFIESHSK